MGRWIWCGWAAACAGGSPCTGGSSFDLTTARGWPWVEQLPEGGISAIAGPERVVLRTPLPLRGEDLKTIGEFEISAGETIPFVLTYGLSNEPPPRPIDAERALHNALAFWRQWSDQCTAAGPWTDTVKRSLV